MCVDVPVRRNTMPNKHENLDTLTVHVQTQLLSFTYEEVRTLIHEEMYGFINDGDYATVDTPENVNEIVQEIMDGNYA
jgi:hypothetical protein